MIRMQRLRSRKAKLILILTLSFVLIGVLFFSLSMFNSVRNPLTEAIESGEATVKAVDINHESIANFAEGLTVQADDLLKTAQISQEQAEVSLVYARHTDDEFVLNMAQNYGLLLESANVMSQGVENLLAVNDDLQQTLNYYGQKSYSLSANSSAICLQTLEPLLANFSANNQTLENINYRYLASGQRDQVKYAVTEYRDAMAIYLQYVQLLKTLKEGTAYEQKANEINDQFNQIQNDIANSTYADAKQRLNDLSKQLDSLRTTQFQNTASLASQLEPSMLSGLAQSTAQDLKNQLRDLTGLDKFQNYLAAVGKYTDASTYLAEGNLKDAEDSANQALQMLAQSQGQSGQGSDISRYSEALEYALNSLKMQIKGQPDQS
jgi:hypothetical protein